MSLTNKFETITYETKNSVSIITLNRPKKLNAINEQMTEEVWEALDQAEKDKNINSVIMKGAGNNFSAGVDLKEVFDRPAPIGEEPSEKWREHVDSMLNVSLKMWDLKVPVIASVDGHALGGAADWVLSADIAIASDKAVFGEPEIRFGSAPPTLMMPWIVGMKKTKELLFTGDSVDAYEGQRIGVFNKVVSQENLEDQTLNMAEKMSNIPPSALKITKVTINKVYEMMNLKEALDYNAESAISMFFLNTEKDIAEISQSLKEEGLGKFLANANSKFEEK